MDKKPRVILVVVITVVALIAVGCGNGQTATEKVLESDKEYAAQATEVLVLVEELEQLAPDSPEANALEEQIADEMPSMIQKFDNYGKPVLKTTDEMKKHLVNLGATPAN